LIERIDVGDREEICYESHRRVVSPKAAETSRRTTTGNRTMTRSDFALDSLEPRRLLAFSGYAQLVRQDDAAATYSAITGTGTTVAVIDTGINYNLDILGGGFGAGKKVIGGYDFYQNDADPMDTDGHGTQVASVIAAKPFTHNGVSYQGVAPDAKLVALRVGTEDDITNNNIERALDWVIDNYKTFNISVVNLSLGSGNYADAETDQFSDEFQTLADLGLFVVAASGNSNDYNTGPISEDGIASPAADPNVFAVGAVNASDIIPSWSQRGDELDLLAPGENIVVPVLNGSTYTTVDGTSFASPYVAGTAALIKQADPTARGGDVGSILMSSAALNRDGDNETGNTTGLLFGRLDIENALRLVGQRLGRTPTLAMGRSFDTALDSQGVLHAAFYDTTAGRVLYATRDTQGLWSYAYVVDASADVGVQVSIAVDRSGKAGIAYFDLTNTAVKYAGFNGVNWSTTAIESDKHTGSDASLAFDTDGHAYIAYYRRSGGQLRLATLDRDNNTWTRQVVDGNGATNVGAYASLDIGEAEYRAGGFTVYDTTIAIAYADVTNGDLKYARIDIDDTTPEWFIATVEDTNGVSSISLDLHNGPLNLGLQAQIGYVDSSQRLVKYAYRNTDWFVEIAASSGRYGTSASLYFDEDDNPRIAYFHGVQRAVYVASRSPAGTWSLGRVSPGSGGVNVTQNERTGSAYLSWLDRARTRLNTITV
jgi:hypothetical protein